MAQYIMILSILQNRNWSCCLFTYLNWIYAARRLNFCCNLIELHEKSLKYGKQKLICFALRLHEYISFVWAGDYYQFPKYFVWDWMGKVNVISYSVCFKQVEKRVRLFRVKCSVWMLISMNFCFLGFPLRWRAVLWLQIW